MKNGLSATALLNMLSEGITIQNLLNSCSKETGNPLLICDSRFRILYMSEEDNIDIPLWRKAQLDRYISNMTDGEQLTDMKILDVRHYIRDNNHRLNAIQMQRLGYYLQELERKRYGYKSGRLIAEMFASNVEALKDKSYIDKMNDVVSSRYRPRVLDDSDIENIINKKKELEFPTDTFAAFDDAVGMG